MAEIYEIIDGLCAERGISASRMSADLGFSRSFMTELRKGRAKSLKLETAEKIAAYFGVPIDYLLTGQRREEAGGDDFSQRFFAAYGDAPPQFTDAQMRDLAKFAKFIKGQEDAHD